MIKHNKKGQLGMTVLIGAIILGVLAVVGFMTGGFSQFGGGGDDTDKSECGVSTTANINAVDALKKGNAVSSPTITARVNGGNGISFTSGNTTLSPGDDVEFLIAKTNFIDIITPSVKIECGTNQVDADLFATSTNTFRIFNSDNTALTDKATLLNTSLSDVIQGSSTAPINLKVFIDSTSDESTGDLIVVVEFENTTEVDNIQFSGNGVSRGDIPSFYSSNSANTIVKAFNVPALEDGASNQYTLSLTPESGETIGKSDTSVFVTAYSAQAFQDTDGSFTGGVEDSDGTDKTEDNWDFDFCIATDNTNKGNCN